MSQQLQYNYVKINLTTGQCVASFTCSYEIPLSEYIEVPYYTDDYMDKYYNLNGDQLWYHDPEFTQIWEECPSHNV